MRAPRKNGLRYRIVKVLINSGPMTRVQIVGMFRNHEFETIREALHQLKFYKTVLIDSNNRYVLTDEAKMHYGLMAAPAVASPALPTCAESKPMSAKYFLPKSGTRPDTDLREVSFKTGSVSSSVVGYWA